jgi:hypothetical protein
MMHLGSLLTRFSLVLTLATATGCALDDHADPAAADDGTGGNGAIDEPLSTSTPGTIGYLNLWWDANYSGLHIQRSCCDSNLRDDGFNNVASSVVNRTASYWMLYDYTGYGGARVCIRPFSHVSNLADVGWNDRIGAVESWGDGCQSGPVIGTPN